MVVILACLIFLCGCSVTSSRCDVSNAVQTYSVKRLDRPPTVDAVWDKSPWRDIKPAPIRHYMGEKPSHRPKTQVKLAYDDTALYVIFRVEDKYVRSVITQPQNLVCNDSCVEFFFTPEQDVSKGFFNLEINAGGTLYFQYQTAPGTNVVKIHENDYQKIDIAHSLPRTVDPEITEPVVWTVAYRLPIDILTRYGSVVSPGPGVRWRANFYKCANQTSHSHWLSWSHVDFPTPNFHLPEFFGVLEFQ